MTRNPKISPNISCLSAQFEGILLDAYGVFWGGNDTGLIPGSKEKMEQLVLDGKIVGILSNSTQLTAKELSKFHLNGLVQGEHFHFLITSGEVARSIFLNEKLPFKPSRNKFWLFGGIHPKFSSHEAIFKDSVYTETTDIEEADFIYISIPHINGEDQVNPEVFAEEIQKLKLKNLPMICANPDQFAHEGKPPKAVVRQGSIAKLYEKMGGQVFYIGKPHAQVFDNAMNQFQKYSITDPFKILMVGDTPETDIRGAKQFGIPSALVLKTGIMGDRITRNGFEKVLKELSSQETPDYFLESL